MAVPSLGIGPGRALDAYSIRTRWAPVLLVVLPLLILCFSLVPGLPAWNKLWPLLGAASIVILVDQLGRDGGKRLQPALWASWGGAPTTAALRHRDAANPVLLARQHERIAAIVGHALPTAHEERADPAGADHAYQAAIAVLIARTRGRRKEYPLIFTENCNYGFRRNMLGLRPWGRLLAASSRHPRPGSNRDQTRRTGQRSARPGRRRPGRLSRCHCALVAGCHAQLGPARRAGLRRAAT